MIHQYKNNGYNIVLDVNSGSVHVVDDMVYDIIGLYENNTLEQITDALRDRYSVQDIKEAYEEIGELKEAGQLFTEDIYEPYIDNFKDRPTVVKALCLHIAHDCNLACKYCFAEEGEYHGRRALMSFEVGKKALDFLIANSGTRRNLEVDFFGGEPLMNFDVVKQIVAYARSIEKEHNKNFRFTLTTNGMLVDDDVIEFANKECHNVVLSLDGRKEVHDHLRKTVNGKGSYDIIVPKFQVLTHIITQTSQTIFFIWRIWDLQSFQWSRLYVLPMTHMHLHMTICLSFLNSTKFLQRKCSSVKKRADRSPSIII